MVYDLPNFTNGTRGIEEILFYETTQIPPLVPALLFFVYMVILLAGFFSQDRKVGFGNFFMWSAISGLIVSTAAFILFLYDLTNSGIVLINIEIVGICVAVTALSAFLFLISDREG